MTNHLFLDTETLGLDMLKHDVWELAYAIDDGKVHSGFLVHSAEGADPNAMRVNNYRMRMNSFLGEITDEFEMNALDTFRSYRQSGNPLTLVGANPSFDAYRLSRRWGGQEPWHYRMVDISSYAMALFRADAPLGLEAVAEGLRKRGYNIPVPDHTAEGDVHAVRECFYALQAIHNVVVGHGS